MAVLITSNGQLVPVTPKGDKFALEELQFLVGGYVEMLPAKGAKVLADEDGRLKNLPINIEASLKLGYPVVGDILFLDKGEF